MVMHCRTPVLDHANGSGTYRRV